MKVIGKRYTTKELEDLLDELCSKGTFPGDVYKLVASEGFTEKALFQFLMKEGNIYKTMYIIELGDLPIFSDNPDPNIEIIAKFRMRLGR